MHLVSIVRSYRGSSFLLCDFDCNIHLWLSYFIFIGLKKFKIKGVYAMAESSGSTGGGIGVFGLLGVVFVILKLTGVITWSWLWVTAPFWGGLALLIGIIAIVALLAIILNKVK